MSVTDVLLKMPADCHIQIRSDIAGWKGNYHQFDASQVGAIQAAWFSGRPLLVRGDPGLGKSQLAPALASYLGFDFHSLAIHADTEINDLLYRIDHVGRLSDSQLSCGAKTLADYVHPGILWQAIAPNILQKGSKSQPQGKKVNGSLVLIDEIDKSDSSLPNALLEVLNNKTITVTALEQVVEQAEAHPVFVVITSNDDRELPAAFLRRCAILDLQLYDGERGIEQLMAIYHVHKLSIKKQTEGEEVDDNEVRILAQAVIQSRAQQIASNDYAAGTSEFLDLVRALSVYPSAKRAERKAQLMQVLVEKRNQREQR